MRTIKFKGKSVNSSEWIEGYYYKECDNIYIIEDRQKDSMFNRNEVVLIAPSTVCQFTGFTDKNGKEIYEGDILDGQLNGEVVFTSGTFALHSIDCKEKEVFAPLYYFSLGNGTLDLKVIGNKFDK